ncbi:unnamed protein product [Rotaria socialis]|uniref:Uncharacterized protein n=1 Tax=Rotaria socialis TaxID=392032 RepID=A0A817VQM6_9BILA|nr:unnamed protein product [Rotaria socialis]
MVDLNLLATVSHRIASVYDLANKYEEAYSFAEAELRIRCNDSNPNFEIVASTPECTVSSRVFIGISIANEYTVLSLLNTSLDGGMCTHRHLQPADLSAISFYAKHGEAICSYLLSMSQLSASYQINLRFCDEYDSEVAQQSAMSVQTLIDLFVELESMHRLKGNYEQARHFSQKREELLNRYTGTKTITTSGEPYLSMGHSFLELKEFDKAVSYFEKSLEIKIANNEECGIN